MSHCRGGTLVSVEGANELIRNIENVIAGSGNDVLLGDGANNILRANDGDDSLDGGIGNDELRGGTGNDTLQGGRGNDIVDGGANNDLIVYAFGDGADAIDGGADIDTLSISGGAGNDTLFVTLNGAGGAIVNFDARLNGTATPSVSTVTNVEAVRLNMAAGNDTLDFSANAVGVTVDLAKGYASGFASIAGVEFVIGSSGADTFVASLDSIRQTFTGGAGNDGVDYSTYTTALNVTLNGNVSAVVSGSGSQSGSSDVIRGIENFTGGSGDDRITGDALSNIIVGGAGNDTLTGGAGSDTFVFKSGYGRDVITDFASGNAPGHDFIQVSMGTSFDTFEEIQHVMTQVDAATVLIAFDVNTSITLRNTTLGSWTSSDFLFV